MNTITFSKADFPQAGECEVGVEETLAVTIIPTKISGDRVTANVTGVEYAEPAEEEVEEAPRRKSKAPSAIAAIGIPKRAYE